MDLRRPLQEETVRDVGYRKLVSIGHTASIGDAIRKMQEASVGCLVVLNGDRLAGIFTERDVLMRVLRPEVDLDTPLAEFVTRDAITVGENDSIYVALARMYGKQCRHIPVLNDAGLPVGSISIKRALHFLGEHIPEVIYNLPPEPNQFPATREGG